MAIETMISAVLNLGTAFSLGSLIGFERQWRQRLAGLRTNTLVALGAAAFVDLGIRLAGGEGGTRIIAYVVSGIGFLGGGVIMKEGTNVRGLNTAATLWCSAAIGAMCGAGQHGFAIVTTAFVILVNLLLRPLVRLVQRQPLATSELESRYAIWIVCHGEAEAHVRALLLRDLGSVLHVQGLESSDIEGSNRVEVTALVRADNRQDRLLEQIVGRLSLEPMVTAARWRLTSLDDI